MTIPVGILRLYGAYLAGGDDAGQRISLFYPTSRTIFPVLPDGKEVLPDSPAGSWGLAWFLGLNTLGQPRFQVRDDVVLNSKIAWHEAGHALEQVICTRLAEQRGTSYSDAENDVRTRYWYWRGFAPLHGNWWDAYLFAQSLGVSGGWQYLPGESVAESISAATGGYVESEWTATYGLDLALHNGIYDPTGGGLRARVFWQEIMREVDMDEATIRAIAVAAGNEALARIGLDANTFEFIKNRLGKDAHHTHTVVPALVGMATSEPIEKP